MNGSELLQQLEQVLEQRRHDADAETSYVARLHAGGINRILQKLGEECTETVLAAKDAAAGGSKDELVHETADLWFHSLVLLSHLGCSSQDVLDELASRFGVSGIDEKAQRQLKPGAAAKKED